MKRYTAQSLAIIVSILVLASVIGFAIYVRIAQESQRVMDERASTEANELVEGIIGLLSTAERESIVSDDFLIYFDEGCFRESLYDEGCRVSGMSLEELNKMLAELGLENMDISGFEEDYCLVDLLMKYLGGDEGLDVGQDYSHAIFLDKVDWENSCNEVSFTMKRLEEASGFVLSALYGIYDEDGVMKEYRDYDDTDTTGFLYEGTMENWETVNREHTITFSKNSETYPVQDLHEIRFKSLGGPSNLTWAASGDCNIKEYISMEVGVTCGGQYAGKHFIIAGDFFAPAVFDYVFFSGEGDLILENQ